MTHRVTRRLALIGTVAGLVLSPTVFYPASGATASLTLESPSSEPSPPPASSDPEPDPSRINPSQRERVLAKGWQKSSDLALASAGDSTGFHILAAKASEGYQWRTVATLSEPGMDTDQWVGNSCLVGSGDKVMAVYAPRHFTNREPLFARGAFAAIVNVATGEVTKLKDQVTLAYFNPGCGANGTVVLTQGASEKENSTRLIVVDTDTKKTTRTTVVPGQVTSAIPSGSHIVAAVGPQLVEVSPAGKVQVLAGASSVPFDLHSDGRDGVVFAEHSDGVVKVRHYQQGRTRMVAEGRLGDLSVRAGTKGRIFLLGNTSRVENLPAAMSVLPASARATVSSEGGLVVKSVVRHGLTPPSQNNSPDTAISGGSSDVVGAESLDLVAQVPATKAVVEFEVHPGARLAPKAHTGSVINPWLAAARQSEASPPARSSEVTSAAEDTVDEGYSCAVPRNDPKTQAYQPHWRQVEWAVDQLVLQRLALTRQANWKGSGLPAWNPQQMFPAEPLQGGGRVPTNIMLGILAQESNLWQAQRNVLEGETGNPLVGNYYGVNVYDSDPSNDWAIDFSKADCGYGVSQQTDGMRRAGYERPGEIALPADKQRALALDYATNIAAGLQTLTKKWNQILADTGGQMKMNDGNPAKIENWYFAIWAYNSGWHPKAEAGKNDGAWGVGWTNNPANPAYRADRHPFLDGNTYTDAAHPQDWPYQEKVLGWAAWPITKSYYDISQKKWQEEAGYNAAWWNNTISRSLIVPAITHHGEPGGTPPYIVDTNAFCLSASQGGDNHNNCVPHYTNDNSIPVPGTCLRLDSKCWWHLPKIGKNNCSTYCGNEGGMRYSDPIYAYTERVEPSNQWTPCLTPGLPSGALIVDDVPRTAPAIRGGCDNSAWVNSGTFSFEFGRDSQGKVPAKADFQQLGNGFGGHEWYAYTRDSAHDGAKFRATGTWTLGQQLHGWSRVLVHLPARRAHAQRAPYTVDLGNGTRKTRTLPQRMENNVWVSLGAFNFDGTPQVSLSNLISDNPDDNPGASGEGAESIAWDAIAFQPLPRKPRHFIVAMGDSYSSGEGASATGGVDYYRSSNNNGAAQKADDPLYPGQTAGDSRFRNACHRSKYAWSRKAKLPDRPDLAIIDRTDQLNSTAMWDPELDYQLIACSGAETENILPFKQPNGAPTTNAFGDSVLGQYRELSQIDKGYLDENTTLVTISVGGNDAGFAPIIEECLKNLINDCYESILKELGDTEQLKVAEPKRIQGPARQSIIQTVKAIHDKAPNAKIVLMGYPLVIQAPCLTINIEEANWIKQTTNLMADMLLSLPQATELQGIPLFVGDPRAAFEGRGACAGTSDEAIHEVVLDTTPGDEGAPSSQSFHPNLAGTSLYAGVLNGIIANMGLTQP